MARSFFNLFDPCPSWPKFQEQWKKMRNGGCSHCCQISSRNSLVPAERGNSVQHWWSGMEINYPNLWPPSPSPHATALDLRHHSWGERNLPVNKRENPTSSTWNSFCDQHLHEDLDRNSAESLIKVLSVLPGDKFLNKLKEMIPPRFSPKDLVVIQPLIRNEVWTFSGWSSPATFWFSDFGVWFSDFRVWFSAFGVWFSAFGVWSAFLWILTLKSQLLPLVLHPWDEFKLHCQALGHVVSRSPGLALGIWDLLQSLGFYSSPKAQVLSLLDCPLPPLNPPFFPGLVLFPPPLILIPFPPGLSSPANKSPFFPSLLLFLPPLIFLQVVLGSRKLGNLIPGACIFSTDKVQSAVQVLGNHTLHTENKAVGIQQNPDSFLDSSTRSCHVIKLWNHGCFGMQGALKLISFQAFHGHGQ